MLPIMGVTLLSSVSESHYDWPPSGSFVSLTSLTSYICAVGVGGVIKGKCCDTGKFSKILMSLLPLEISSKWVTNRDTKTVL